MNANEPVAWMNKHGEISIEEHWAYPTPLYTHPAKEITDEEIDEVVRRWFGNSRYDFSANTWRQFSRAILRKVQEK
ncbi:hypothetical protein UFOVP11_65 [uncultured Caudovirales phage]|uniref:Uncharacterized protein n=1 Tax=uncultured Caudovirales phage TaxID=2100421 RepID=A0A6J5KK08_9CAUD|nr:hypothetical protein UFOVP11_65 [uncultured Caudovirales phage]